MPIPRKWYPTSKYNPPGSRKTCPYKAFLSEHELRMASVEPITSKKVYACLSGSDTFLFITIPNPSEKVGKEINPVFSPKINKNREKERRKRG